MGHAGARPLADRAGVCHVELLTSGPSGREEHECSRSHRGNSCSSRSGTQPRAAKCRTVIGEGRSASNDGKAPPTPTPTTEKMASPSPVAQAALHGVPSGTFAVLLKGNNEVQECWVSIVVDGQPPYEITLVAPEQKLIPAKNEVIVKAGSVGALDVFFNGQKLPPQGGYGIVKTLTFHADGLQAAPLKPVGV